MAMSIHEIFKRKLVPIGFERTMGLLGATTLGIGALMGAGIYVLIGLATGHAGPAIWLSYLVCGLLSLLSVLVFGELSRRMPITGGGYAFVYNSLGSFWGFLTGWLLAVGSIFACAMYAIGFAYYFTSLFPHHFPESVIKGIALVVIAFLTLINCRGTKGGNRVQKIFTWGNLLVLLCLILLSIPKAEPERLKPVFSQGLNGLGGAIAIIYVSFFGYQLVANNAEEIINPKTTVPRAMLLAMIVSLSFYVAVALISVMVVPWNVLAQSKAPLVEVAQKGIGRLGSLFIAVSLGSSINLDLMVRLAGAVADRFGGGIIFLNVLPTNYTPEQKAHSGKILVEAIKHHVAKALYKIEVESSDEPLEFLLKRSRGFDLLIVGATKVGLLERAVVGTFSSQIAIRSECAVAVVRAAPLTRKWLSI